MAAVVVQDMPKELQSAVLVHMPVKDRMSMVSLCNPA